jgi:hypothetical protein
MRHGEIPTLNVVLDDHQAAGGAQIPAQQSHDGILVHLKVERVRHNDSVERRKRERHGEVSFVVENGDLWEPGSHCVGICTQGAAVPIDGVDLSPRPQEIREGECESA